MKRRERYVPAGPFDVGPSMAEKTYAIRMLVRIAVIVTVAGILIAFAPFAYRQWHTFANTTVLEPVLCTGDWDTDTGLPSTKSLGQTWFCSFAALALSQPEEVSSATLALSFSVSRTPETTPLVPELPQSERAPILEEPVSVDSGVEGEVAGVETTEEVVADQEMSTEEVSSPPPPLPTSEEESVPIEEAVLEENTETVSRWFFGIPSVFAQTNETPDDVSEETVSEAHSPLIEHTPEPPVDVVPTIGDVLGESVFIEEPLGLGGGTVVALSYTTDGTVWTYIDSVSLEEGVHTFPLELSDTNELERLVVRLVTESAEKDVTVTLTEVSLTLVTIPEAVEPVIVEISTETPALPAPRAYERVFTIDPNATHLCSVFPEVIDVSDAESREFVLSLTHGTSTGQEIVELGSMPYGIDLTFEENDAYRFLRAERTDSLRVHITTLPGAQRGSMSIPVIYRKDVDGRDSFTTCQINIINI